MSPDMLVIAFHFNPLKDLLSWPYGGLTLHVVYFYLLIEVRSIKSKDRNDLTSCSHLASSTNLHSLQTGYWSPVTVIYCLLTGRGIISATRLIVASFVCILPHDVCQPKHKKHNNITPTIATKINESQTNICRFTCVICRCTGHYKTWQRLPSDVTKSRLCYR